MSKRVSPAASAVEFFQTAPIDVAREVLAICVRTVKVRDRETPSKPSTRSRPARQEVASSEVAAPPRS